MITCPRCNGDGIVADLSAEGDPWPCVTCNETGEVYEYESQQTSSGGVTVEVRVVGHRPLAEANAPEGVSRWADVPSRILGDYLRALGVRP